MSNPTTPEPARTTQTVEQLLGDLELGSDDTGEAVTEDFSELDVYGSAHVDTNATLITEQEKIIERPEPLDLVAQMRAYRAKNAPNATLSPDDPQATEKIALDRYLKKNGRSSADLPEGFWNEPNRAARGSMLGQIIGEARAEERAAKRLERLTSVGYPSDYSSRPRDEQRRISATVRSRRRRAKSAPTRAAGFVRLIPAVTIPAATITRDWCADRLARLKRWTEGTEPLARQLRGRERDLVRAAAHYHTLSAELGRPPSHGELSGRIGCTRRTARNRVRLLVSLYAIGAPWHSKA